MARSVAIQMDPIGSINPKTDSTLLLGLEAQKRGYQIYYYTPDKLTWRDGALTAAGHRITLYKEHDRYHELGEALIIDLSAMDVILLRQDPPFDMAYLTTTYWLERLQPKVLVVNNPAAVRNHPEKIFPTLFKEFMPPTLVTADTAEIERFRRDYKDIVIKPLYGFGGNSVMHIAPRDDFSAVLETHLASLREPVMVQPFLPEVKAADRRIIMIDGKVSAVVGRIPAGDEFRANLRLGGTATKAELSKRQKELCDTLGPELKKYGLVLAGVDVIGDYLTEINLTSPTTLASANALYNQALEAEVWDAIEAYRP